MILAPNHASFMDHFFTGAFIRRRIQFMGKSQLFGSGPLSWIFSHGGVFPVRRGHQDEEAFISAFKILERGGAVVMYCEGGRSRTGELADAGPAGHRAAGARVGRAGRAGGDPRLHQVRNWKRLQFPKVTVQYGEPFKFEVVREHHREQQQEAADYILETGPNDALRARAARRQGRAAAARARPATR